MTANVKVKDPTGRRIYTIDWAAFLGSALLTTPNGVTHTVPAELTVETETNTTTTSQVELSGGIHGQLYRVEALGTLNTGEQKQAVFNVRVFNV